MMLCSLGLGQEGYQLESDKATRGLYRIIGVSRLSGLNQPLESDG